MMQITLLQYFCGFESSIVKNPFTKLLRDKTCLVMHFTD